MALITGQNPSDIEANWDEADVNWMLLVHRAQQNARIQLAKRSQTALTNVPVPSMVVVAKDGEDDEDELIESVIF